ncbi:hypothetical protein N7532_001100 [Penicillium argentinense]|uniref:Uncharacterized protein n=1 Tax=Penicillium argentinense TaxID=1131581 RepID=A0A9W9KLD8_9EURO|nr:uncharacterized protein N7532_001100 [Penicillium argentinense]KAJ5110565.1 hypothetical protein N7532_001100 [Penicillium argentinense]
MVQSTCIHDGYYETMAPDASPGLLFLKSFLPAFDSLDPTTSLEPFFAPRAPILMCNNPPIPERTRLPSLESRRQQLKEFHHEVHTAWDIDLSSQDHTTSSNANGSHNNSEVEQADTRAPYVVPSNSGILKRTVMFESTSRTIFKDDPDEFAVKVREFNILELEGHSADDLQIVEMRIFVDAKPVQARAQQLRVAYVFGEGAREAEPQ